MTDAIRRPKANFLRLVRPPQKVERVDASAFARFGWQNTLFASDHPSLLVTVDFDALNAADFISLLTTSRAKYLFDLRRVPRFDSSHLNRRLVFDLFQNSGIEYVDVSGRTGVVDAAGTARFISQFSRSRRSFLGPVILLIDRQNGEEYIVDLVESLPSPPDGVWDILQLPFEAPTALPRERSLVFVSHANPEDNDFATWLSGKLAIAGYQVWSDITQLIGGEIIWSDIEDAIRNNVAKVIVVVSRSSQNKNGVLDEIDLAIRVERALKIPRFVIPVRLDNLSFADVRANLARKNIIDFHDNWAGGLSALLKTLRRDEVPQAESAGAPVLGSCLKGGVRATSTVIEKHETLITNWLPVQSFGNAIELMDVDAPLSEFSSIIRDGEYPTFQYMRLIGAISDDERPTDSIIAGRRVTRKYSVPIDEFISGRSSDLPGMREREAKNLLSVLLRRGWNKLMQKRGFSEFMVASGASAWFVPHKLLDGDKISFLSSEERRTRKQLVGWSDRRQVFWHAAFEGRVVMDGPPRIVLRPHVIFTNDGRQPLYSTQRMHVLRRSFCKSWWNDRWRDLMLGFIEVLKENDEVRLDMGPSVRVVLGHPLRLEAGFAPREDDNALTDDADPVDALDSLDEDGSFESEAEEEHDLSSAGFE